MWATLQSFGRGIQQFLSWLMQRLFRRRNVTPDDIVNLQPSINHLRTASVVRAWSTTTEIDWNAAITLAELCKLAYDNAAIRQQKLREWGFDFVQLFDMWPNSAFVAGTGDVLVIAFRGTNEAIDWITNGDFGQLSETGHLRKLHTGFQHAYGVFAESIRKLVGERKPKHVWITGHSLGGAMAACCAYDFAQKCVPFTEVVTFGQPRIGNAALGQYLNDEIGTRYVRFMNECDPVPIMPPSIVKMMPSYWHSGRRIWFCWGQIFTIDGPTPFAAQAPGTESNVPAGYNWETCETPDTTPSMTEEEFLELQQQLKAERQDQGRHASAPVAKDAKVDGSALQGLGQQVVDFFKDRIGEHGMDAYLRTLNQYRENA